jgi:hypothetical protein
VLDPRIGAAALAVALATIAASAVIFNRRFITVTVVGLVLGVPVVGLAAYAFIPSAVPGLGPFALSAVFSTVVAAIALFGASRSPRVPLRRRAYLYLMALGGSVIGMASILALWQPGFGIADIALAALWAAAWLPPGQRTTDVQTSIDVSTPRSTAFAFLADPSNWPKYQDSTDSVRAEPGGPLGVGTRVTVVSSGPDFGGRQSSDSTEVTYFVDDVVPNSSVELIMLGQPADRITWHLSDSPIGMTMAARAWGVVPYPLAVFGLVLEFRQYWTMRVSRAQSTLVKLKQLLEGSQPQPS